MQRLRIGDWITGGSALALFGFMFLDFFAPADIARPAGANSVIVVGLPGGFEGGSGWSTLGWAALLLVALAIVAGLAVPLVAATRESTTGPVATAIAGAIAGLAAVVALLVQVVFQPGPDELVSVQAGWWLGLAAALGVWLGSFTAMVDERSPGATAPPVEVRPLPPVA